MNDIFSENSGIPSLWLVNMMNRWEQSLCHVHGYVILKDGTLVAEAYQYPYTKNARRILHSVSKTVTAIAIGIAASEGLLSAEDQVVSFFPEYQLDKNSSQMLSKLKVKHLLTMSVGHAQDNIDSIYAKDVPGWKAFLDTEIVDEPGTKFIYNSGASYMLSKILTIVTGKTMLDYLTPRLFEPLGITDADWNEIDGANAGGWGCRLSLTDMARIGQMLLQQGMWNGRQIVPEQWIREMSGKKIDTAPTNVFEDWRVGYGYQMWRCSREGCYRADGAFGQYILVLPPKNMVVAIWSEDAFSQDMLNAFWEEVYDKVDDRVYGIDGNAHEVYRRKCIQWQTPKILPPSYSYMEPVISGKEYESVSENSPADSIQVLFTHTGQAEFYLTKDGQTSEIIANNTSMYFGADWMSFETACFIRLGKPKEKTKYAASYQWLSDHTILLHINWLEAAHSTDINFVFGEGQMSAVFSVSYRKFVIKQESTPAYLITDQWFAGKCAETVKEDNLLWHY